MADRGYKELYPPLRNDRHDLLDTSGLLSAIDASQRYHAECVAALSKASPPPLRFSEPA